MRFAANFYDIMLRTSRTGSSKTQYCPVFVIIIVIKQLSAEEVWLELSCWYEFGQIIFGAKMPCHGRIMAELINDE